MLRTTATAVTFAMTLLAGGPAIADTYSVNLDGEAVEGPQSGRLILFFVEKTDRRSERRMPASGPSYSDPAPIASIPVEGWEPGTAVQVPGVTEGYPGTLDELAGSFRIQAVLKVDDTTRSHLEGVGNLVSPVVEVDLDPAGDEHVELTLSQDAPGFQQGPLAPNLFYVEFKSELLSEFYGRDVYHRAGVAVPLPYLDDDHHRQEWPAIYVVPGFGGRHNGAWDYGEMFRVDNIEDIAPMAVHIVLDPDSPLGHHGFVDSPNHGPRGTALVTELIPHLEREFKLASDTSARIVTGHSSGGWSSLWLQLTHPDVFGACWSSAPDPIDFTAFQMTDLYADESMYTMSDGGETPSYRRPIDAWDNFEVLMTVREEYGMEHALHPTCGSGEQWDTWMAMFSPRDESTGFPKAMFDAKTGAIDREVVKHWSEFDISRLVIRDWPAYGPILMERVRLSCGEIDSFYLQRAVKRFKTNTEALAAENGGWTGPGYIVLVPDATHGNLTRFIFQRKNREMREFLGEGGWHD